MKKLKPIEQHVLLIRSSYLRSIPNVCIHTYWDHIEKSQGMLEIPQKQFLIYYAYKFIRQGDGMSPFQIYKASKGE